MTQQQRQSQFSRVPSRDEAQDASPSQGQSQGPSLSPPAAADATSPYEGPAQKHAPEQQPDHVADARGPEAMEQPYFSEAQSTLAAYAPAERPGDPFAEPEDPIPTHSPAEQPQGTPDQASGAEFATAAGTVRAGMPVVDSYGHAIGIIAGVDGERMRLTSTDPHDDGIAFLPVSLIDGIDGERVLLGGRGDASFGMSGE